MDEATAKALKGSIEKWRKILEAKGEDNGADNCPLCHIFRSGVLGKDDCDGCPVKAHSGLAGCEGTPYETWHKHHIWECPTKPSIIDGCAKCEALAKAELAFLESLRPTALDSDAPSEPKQEVADHG